MVVVRVGVEVLGVVLLRTVVEELRHGDDRGGMGDGWVGLLLGEGL